MRPAPRTPDTFPARRQRSGVWASACLGLSLLASGAFAAPTSCPGGDSPEAVAKAFFTQHRNFTQGHPKKIKAWLTPRFYQALEAEYRCAQGEVCALDFDVWTAAQDGDLGLPLKVGTARVAGSVAEVPLSYRFVLGPRESKAMGSTLRLTQEASSPCWRVADLVGPNGDSTLKLLEDFQAANPPAKPKK